jgi:hypothetical protein
MRNDDILTFKEYFQQTKFTTTHCLKITGIIFTIICMIFLILSDYKNIFTFSDSVVTPLKWYIICIALGNCFGLFICFLALTSAYKSVKSTYSLFHSIPQEIKEKFDIGMTFEQENPKYNYLKIQIVSNKPGTPMFIFRYLPQKEIQITIVNQIDDDINFPKYQLDIDKKYKKQQISLTGWGLSTTIKLKKWKQLTQSEIEDYINELIITSEKEGMVIIKNEY